MKLLLVALMCVSLASSRVEASQSKVAIQKSNAQVLNATASWMTDKIENGGYDIQTPFHRFVKSYSDVTFQNGVAKLVLRSQTFTGKELMVDETSEITFALKRLDRVVVESHNIGAGEYEDVVLYTRGDEAVQIKTTVAVDKMREVDENGNLVKKAPRAKVETKTDNAVSISFSNSVDAQAVASAFGFAILMAKDS